MAAWFLRATWCGASPRVLLALALVLALRGVADTDLDLIFPSLRNVAMRDLGFMAWRYRPWPPVGAAPAATAPTQLPRNLPVPAFFRRAGDASSS